VTGSPSESKRLHLLVEGHVQGVGFRFTTAQIASRFPVVGFVRNLPDGSVEIIAEGAEASVLEFWSALKQNRIYRHVMREHISWEPPRADIREFSISYL